MPNKPHVPTEKTRKQVQVLVAAGIPEIVIGKILGLCNDIKSISDNTLRKYYADEIEYGTQVVIGNVAGKVYEAAMSGNMAAAFFLLKTRGGWRETNRTELTGPDGKPIETKADTSKLEEAFDRLEKKIASGAGK